MTVRRRTGIAQERRTRLDEGQGINGAHGTEETRMSWLENRLLKPDEVAQRLGLTRRGVLGGPLRRKLPWIPIANTLRLFERDLQKYIEAQRDGTRTVVRGHHER